MFGWETFFVESQKVNSIEASGVTNSVSRMESRRKNTTWRRNLLPTTKQAGQFVHFEPPQCWTEDVWSQLKKGGNIEHHKFLPFEILDEFVQLHALCRLNETEQGTNSGDKLKMRNTNDIALDVFSAQQEHNEFWHNCMPPPRFLKAGECKSQLPLFCCESQIAVLMEENLTAYSSRCRGGQYEIIWNELMHPSLRERQADLLFSLRVGHFLGGSNCRNTQQSAIVEVLWPSPSTSNEKYSHDNRTPKTEGCVELMSRH